jgi:subtilisin-like proprotein convertase family protein
VFAGGNDRATGRSTEDLNETNSRYGITVGGINAATDLGSLVISGQPFSEQGASILVSAPANNVTSTGVTYTNDFGQQFGANYQTTQGTSFATPIVSGVVALMLQANSSLGYRDIQEILAYSAVKVDPTDSTWSFNGATNWNGGGLHVSGDYGYGEVDAHAAVRLAATWQTQDTAANEQSVNFNEGQFSTSASTATSLNYAIPVDQGASIPAINLTLPGGLSVEHVDVELNLVGVRMSDLIVKLIAPSGETSILTNREGNTTGQQGTDAPQNLDFTFDTVDDWGELSGGTWKLEVYYAAGTTPVGTVAGVNVTAYGSSSGSATPQTYIYTDEFAQLAAAPAPRFKTRTTLPTPSTSRRRPARSRSISMPAAPTAALTARHRRSRPAHASTRCSSATVRRWSMATAMATSSRPEPETTRSTAAPVPTRFMRAAPTFYRRRSGPTPSSEAAPATRFSSAMGRQCHRRHHCVRFIRHEHRRFRMGHVRGRHQHGDRRQWRCGRQ